MKCFGAERTGATPDKADGRLGARRRVLQEDLVDGGNGGVPGGVVGVEVLPELGGTELERYDDAASGEQWCQKTCEQAVDVEKRHDKEGAVFGRQFVGLLNVLYAGG